MGDMTLFCRVCDPTLCSLPTSVRWTASEIERVPAAGVWRQPLDHNPRGRKLQGPQDRVDGRYISVPGHGRRRRRTAGQTRTVCVRSILVTTGRRSPRPQGGGDALGTTMIKIAGKIFVVGRCRQCYRFLLVRPPRLSVLSGAPCMFPGSAAPQSVRRLRPHCLAEWPPLLGTGLRRPTTLELGLRLILWGAGATGILAALVWWRSGVLAAQP